VFFSTVVGRSWDALLSWFSWLRGHRPYRPSESIWWHCSYLQPDVLQCTRIKLHGCALLFVVTVIGRFRRSDVTAYRRQASRRWTVYLFTESVITWHQHADVRASYGAGRRLRVLWPTDNDSEAARCGCSTLSVLLRRVCVIIQLWRQQYMTLRLVDAGAPHQSFSPADRPRKPTAQLR